VGRVCYLRMGQRRDYVVVRMTTREILTAARELIADPRAWIQGTYSVVMATTGQACYCGFGALHAVALSTMCESDARRRLNAVTGGDFMTWQDEPRRTHGEVLAAFDRAIEATS